MTTDNYSAESQTRSIPAFDYLEGLSVRREAILSAIARVIDSGTLILGPEVAAFESEFAQFVGAHHTIGTSSGTDALIIALRTLSVGAGDEVITVANGPVPTVAAICAVGATPRFVDIDAVTLQMDPDHIRTAMTPRTRCVIPIHLYGLPAPVERIASICGEFGVAMIEDCAQAHGTLVGGKHAGHFGAIGCFSFYPTKNLGAFGDAGMCITSDDAFAAQLREQTCYGFRGDRIAHCEGLNCRLDELQAACLRVQLQYLLVALTKRASIAWRYFESLSELGIVLPAWPTHARAAWHQFVIRVKMRSEWIAWLNSQQIHVGLHYATPVHLMPAYCRFGEGEGSLPITEQACREVISLPMFPELDDVRVARVAEAIVSGYRTGLH